MGQSDPLFYIYAGDVVDPSTTAAPAIAAVPARTHIVTLPFTSQIVASDPSLLSESSPPQDPQAGKCGKTYSEARWAVSRGAVDIKRRAIHAIIVNRHAFFACCYNTNTNIITGTNTNINTVLINYSTYATVKVIAIATHVADIATNNTANPSNYSIYATVSTIAFANRRCWLLAHIRHCVIIVILTFIVAYSFIREYQGKPS
jgi:hypothetical protein